MSSICSLVFLFLAIVFVSSAAADKKKECSYCKYDYDCATHFCFKNKCIYRNRASLSKCFTDLCGDCKYDYECISERCYKHKCVPKLNPHFKKCFPHKPKPSASSTSTATATPTPTPSPSPKKDNCEPCKYGYECAIGKCTNYYCGTPYTLRYCPTASPSPSMSMSSTPSPSPKKDNCEPCKYGYECSIGYCTNYYCGTSYTLKYCPTASPSPTSSPSMSSTPSPSPKKPDCAYCKYGYECAAGYCSDYYCGKPHAVQKCKKDECDECSYDYECKSGKCKRGICIKNYNSLYKCKH